MNAKISAFLRCPPLPHKRTRSTNLIERAFAEQGHRTKTIPRFWNERVVCSWSLPRSASP
jgi:transposase-like protein